MSGVRGVASADPRATPLTIVEAAVAGNDLLGAARSAAEGLGCPVAIALPTLGPPVLWPPGSRPPKALENLQELSEAVPVRIGQDVIGFVAALPDGGPDPGDAPHRRAWLDAAAAAAAVTALMRDSSSADASAARRALLEALALQPPRDLDALVAQGRRLGFELSGGAIGICAAVPVGEQFDLASTPVLLAQVGDRVLGLLPLAGENGLDDRLAGVLAELEATGLHAVASAPRPAPALLHEALREATLLGELATDPGAMFASQEETYRLLIGVLLRDSAELERLRTQTISPLEQYDSHHDTELVATLDAFLAHHGSTTETADAMSLHRHTVGYRLARVQEVSGLSPYESDGRERLSLGLKAHRILTAAARLA